MNNHHNSVDQTPPDMGGQHIRGVGETNNTEGNWLTVKQAVAHCASKGLFRTSKTVRRWAHRSIAHPEVAEVIAQKQDTETDFRYIIERNSLDVKIEQELRFEAQNKTTESAAPDPPSSDMSSHGTSSEIPKIQEKSEVDQSTDVHTGSVKGEPASTKREDQGPSETSSDLLRDQISEKDRQIHNLYKQLERRDEQIMAMLERDRETNILIKGLQEALLPNNEDATPNESRRLNVRSESMSTEPTASEPSIETERIGGDGVYYQI